MLGAIAGDIIGSVHEFIGTKSTNFELFVQSSTFTDDTVLAVAVADSLLHGLDYVDSFHEYFKAYPDAGWGLRFFDWANAGRRERTTATAMGRLCACRRWATPSTR